jgi:ATP-binding cassette subfamily B protein
MFKMVRYIKELSGKESRRLIAPICLSVMDSLLNSCMYGVMLLLLLNLAERTFTDKKLWIYTGVMAGIFVLRCIAQAISFTGAQCTGADVTYHLRLRIANHLRKLNLGFF